MSDVTLQCPNFFLSHFSSHSASGPITLFISRHINVLTTHGLARDLSSLDIAMYYGHSSLSCRFLLIPLSALAAGPQFGVGFCW